MTFRALLVTYILGGLTFIPLILAALLVPAWLALPKVATHAGEDGSAADDGGKSDEETKKKVAEIKARKRDSISTEAAAEATFAVLRSFDFQAANAALNARNTSGNTAGGVTGTTDGEGDGNDAAGASVYQSVYRSVFAPVRSSTTVSSSREVLENEEPSPAADGRAKKKTTPANVFYIVLRHGHLMLYDSASQLEVRHVISLAHHTVSLSDGSSPNGEDEIMKDGDLFIKRTAIVLTPVELPNGHLQSQTSATKPFYLFSTLCSEKEDFYHALLYTRANPPIPEPIDPDDAIKLQSTLHSTSLTPETRALNALIGRVFLGIYHTDWLKNLIQSKIEKKISRVQKPSFLEKLTVKSIDLGDAAPVLSNHRLKDLNISGEMVIAFDLRYNGGVNITISAEARLDLGPRFKTRTVDLVLATSLQRLSGHMLIRIKPPPSNRIWFCFETPPEMDVKVEPVVSQRKISYTFILRTIEDRIRAVVTETLVKPNWDDVPFFSTMAQQVRGGIWHHEGSDRDPSAAEKLAARDAKSKSMPALPLGADHDSSAGSSGSETTSKIATGSYSSAKDLATELKRRSVASLPARSATNQSTSSAFNTTPEPGNSPNLPPQRPLRSPSFTSPSASQPSVALDESLANVDPNRAADPNAQSKRWRLRQAAPPLPARREAVEAMREMRDRVLAHREAAEASATQADVLEGVGSYVEEPVEGINSGDEAPEGPDSRRTSDSPAASVRTHRRTDTNVSTASTASAGSQSQKKTILAATAAATTAARNWSWNALANARTKGSPTAQQGSFASNGQQQQPMGRGQPLPPPGMPLPGPQKGLFGALGSVRRKPVPKIAPTLPTRRTDAGRSGSQTSDFDGSVNEVDSQPTENLQSTVSDEYGPWSENSGIGDESVPDDAKGGGITTFASAVEAATSQQRQSNAPRFPPPLPKRKDTGAIPQPINDPSDSAAQSNGPSQETSTSGSSFLDPTIPSDELIDPSKAPAAQSPAQAETKFMLGADLREEDFEHDRSTQDTDVPMSAPQEEETHEVLNDDSSEEIVAVPAPLEEDEDFVQPFSNDNMKSVDPEPKSLDQELSGKDSKALDDSQESLHS